MPLGPLCTVVSVGGVPVAGVPVAGVPVAGVPVAGVPVAGVSVDGVEFAEGTETAGVDAVESGTVLVEVERVERSATSPAPVDEHAQNAVAHVATSTGHVASRPNTGFIGGDRCR